MDDVPSALQAIREAIADGRVLFGPHARKGMAGESPVILPQDVIKAISGGEILEYYPDDPRGACCLILGRALTGEPVHVVVSLPRPDAFVITVYRPEESRWENHRRRRKGSGNE